MAAAESARLIAELTFKDKMSAGMATANKSLDKLDRNIATVSKRTGAISGAVNRMLTRGVDAGINALIGGVQGGISSLVDLESATTSVDGAVKTMGLTGKITGAQVADMANKIEASTQAAFDDKDITRATGTLLRFGKLAPANLEPAMQVMTDLAAKTGSVDGAATMLAKALADPAKAAGALKRAGVVLTASQQKQIAALVKSGKLEKAQALLLKEIGRNTEGAAAAMNGPMKDAQQTLADVGEDATRALATGLMPVLQRVQKDLAGALANPKTMAAIKGFGDGLAGAFDSLVTFAEGVDWGRIGDGLKTVADWGGKAIGAFSKIPPEAMAFILALGGINKVTGGAITGIVGELGKGLIKGVLGMNAGIVNLNAAVVKSNSPDLPGGPGGGKPGVGKPGTPGMPESGAKGNLPGVVGLIAASSVVVRGDTVQGMPGGAVSDKALLSDLKTMLAQGRGNEKVGANETVVQAIKRLEAVGVRVGSFIAEGTRQNDPTGFLNSSQAQPILKTLGDTHSEQLATTAAVEGVKTKQAESLVAFRAGERTAAAAGAATTLAARMAGVTGAVATMASAGRITGAIASNRPIVTTNVNVNVTAASVTKSVSVASRYGATGASRSENSRGGK